MTTETDTAPISHRIGAEGTLSLRTVAGTVRLRGNDGDVATVSATSASGEAARLVVRREAGSLLVEPEQRERSFLGVAFGTDAPEIDFVVELPRRARIELQSVSADVDGEGLHGDQSYKLVSGDVELERLGGRLEIQSVSGDARVAAELPLDVNARTTSGDIHVEAAGLTLLRLRSVSGDVAIAGRLLPGPEHRVETVSGDLAIRPQGGLTVEVAGSAVGPVTASEGTLGRNAGSRQLVFGDGSARLRFRSMSGELHVIGSEERSAAAPAAVTPAAATPAAATPARATPAAAREQLAILQAVERGEMDVEEASRLLSEEAERA